MGGIIIGPYVNCADWSLITVRLMIGDTMTDDTLRIECAPMIDRICYTVTLPENAGRPDRVETAIADMLLSFARAQQARGLREAAGLYRDWVDGKWFDAMEFQDALEAQATAREEYGDSLK